MESLVNGHLLTKGNRTLAFANGVKAGIEVKLQLHAESGRSTVIALLPRTPISAISLIISLIVMNVDVEECE